MADPEEKKSLPNVEIKDCKYVIIGDGTIINLPDTKDDADDMKDAIKILSTLSILPGKPFHKCCTRTDEVKKIISFYENIWDPTGMPRVVTLYVTGPPGSGKTQLARQFGEQFLESTPNYETSDETYPPFVLTLNADSTKSLLKSTKNLLDELKVTKTSEVTKDGEVEEIDLVRFYIGELRKMMKRYPGKWLLILDNMFRDKEINEILPLPGSEGWGEGKVIVTSQDSDLAPACHEYAENFSLKSGMNETGALALLREISGIAVDEHAIELAKELEYFPLSLACSATYVGQMIADRPSSGFSWKQFLALYRNQKGSLTYRTYVAYNVYPYSMVVAARLAAKRLAECSTVLQHTFDFLSYCTLNPVPLIIVSNFVQARLASKDIICDEIKAEISRCSLLLSVPSGFLSVECIKFHQVMGESFKYAREERNNMQNLDEEAKRSNYIIMLKSLKESLDAAIPNYDHSSVVLKILASPHLKSFVNYGKSKTWNTSPEFVIILAFLADSLYHVPGVTEAERMKHVELAYEIARNLPHPMNALRYCQVLKTLGFYYREANHLDKSVTVLNEALCLAENQTNNTWLTLKSSVLNVLSWTYKLQMKLDLAEQKMKESIELAKQVFGEHHEEIVERLCNFAIIYREKCELEKAKEIVDDARRIADIATDEWHLTRAQAANYSAKIYLRCAEMNDNAEQKRELLTTSLKLHAEALNIYENVLGENHIYVAGVCMSYAVVYKELKAYDEALEQVERAVMIYSEVNHVVLSAALRYKTEVLLAIGCASKQAEQAIKRSIELSNCGRARFLLAHTYLQQNRFQEARVIFKEVLTRWKSGVLPATHFWVKHAEQLKAECDREIVKKYVPIIVMIIFIFLSGFFGFWMNS